MSGTESVSPPGSRNDSYQLREPLSCNDNSSNSTFFRKRNKSKNNFSPKDLEIQDITERLFSIKSLQKENEKEFHETQVNDRIFVNKLEESLQILQKNSDIITNMKKLSSEYSNQNLMTKIEKNISKLKSLENMVSNCYKNEIKCNGRTITSRKISKIEDLVKEMVPIGHGGEGRVYRGIMIGSNEKVVVKSYFLDCEPSSRIEFGVMTICSHIDAVKKPLGLYQTNHKSYLIFADDHNSVPLDLVSEQIRLVDSEIQFLFSQIVSILKSLKSALIKHRDIKLDNFLLNVKKGKLSIIDFGWSMYCGLDNVSLMEVRRSGETLMGTFDYLPPEMNSPPQTIVSYEKASVFALGCILIEFFFGYLGNMVYHMMRENLNSFLQRMMFQKKIKIPNGAINVIENCLKMNPADRFSLEDLIQHPWILTNRAIELTNLKDSTKTKALHLSQFLQPKKKD